MRVSEQLFVMTHSRLFEICFRHLVFTPIASSEEYTASQHQESGIASTRSSMQAQEDRDGTNFFGSMDGNVYALR